MSEHSNNFIRLQEANAKIERQAKIITDLERSREALLRNNVELKNENVALWERIEELQWDIEELAGGGY